MAQLIPEVPDAAKGRCPICREPATIEDRPFCSRRCANIDLYRWLSDGYAIAGREDAEEDGAEGTVPAAAGGNSPSREDDDADA